MPDPAFPHLFALTPAVWQCSHCILFHSAASETLGLTLELHLSSKPSLAQTNFLQPGFAQAFAFSRTLAAAVYTAFSIFNWEGKDGKENWFKIKILKIYVSFNLYLHYCKYHFGHKLNFKSLVACKRYIKQWFKCISDLNFIATEFSWFYTILKVN